MYCSTTMSIMFGGSTVTLHEISHRLAGRRWGWFGLGSCIAGVWVLWDDNWLRGSMVGGETCKACPGLVYLTSCSRFFLGPVNITRDQMRVSYPESTDEARDERQYLT